MTLSGPISKPQLSDPVHPPSTRQRCHRGSIFHNSSISSFSRNLLSLSVHLQTASTFLPFYRHYLQFPVSVSFLHSLNGFSLYIFKHIGAEAEALDRLVILGGKCKAAIQYAILLNILYCTVIIIFIVNHEFIFIITFIRFIQKEKMYCTKFCY